MPSNPFMVGRQVTGDGGENITSYRRGAFGFHVHLKNLGPNVAYIGTDQIYTSGFASGYPLGVGETLKIWVPPGVSPALTLGIPDSEYIHAITEPGSIGGAEIAVFTESNGPDLFA